MQIHITGQIEIWEAMFIFYLANFWKELKVYFLKIGIFNLQNKEKISTTKMHKFWFDGKKLLERNCPWKGINPGFFARKYYNFLKYAKLNFFFHHFFGCLFKSIPNSSARAYTAAVLPQPVGPVSSAQLESADPPSSPSLSLKER